MKPVSGQIPAVVAESADGLSGTCNEEKERDECKKEHTEAARMCLTTPLLARSLFERLHFFPFWEFCSSWQCIWGKKRALKRRSSHILFDDEIQ